MTLAVLLSAALAQTTPQPAATGPCLHEAQALHVPTAAYPESAAKGSVQFAIVTITVGGDGIVQKAVIYKSTGNAEGDKEALRVARATTYAPKVVDCKPATGVYRLRVDFSPSL